MSKKQPEVIVFEDPSEKFKLKQKKIKNAIFQEKENRRKEKEAEKEPEGWKTSDHYDEIRELANSDLDYKKKARYELEKIGIKVNTQQKMPLKRLMSIRQGLKKNIRKAKRKDKAEGIVRAKKHQEKKRKENSGDVLKFQPGSFRDGVLHLNKEAFKRR
ncbi:hypothetical protein WA158_001667 [Blastocystis sp. Blastoise]